jgi:[CysO sulfur-carrier protein]-thiocarboxylate-dependent cysteine synthase
MSTRLENRPCGGRYGDIVQAIGNTPLVELKRLSPKPGVRIWAKLESHNPTGSVKDRVARSLIEDAEERGAIEPGQTILEPTSGNTGISLAMICSRKGYPVEVVMPDNVTPERTQLLEMYGAKITYSEGAKGSNGAVEKALEMAGSNSRYYMPYQYGNPANPLAHYNGTAPEILEELDEVTAFVAGLGTGGTLMGNGRRLREELGDSVKIVAAEPMQGEPVQGLRSLDDGFIPPIIDLSVLDRKIFVTNRDAIVWTRKLLEEEGIFAGVSSGAIAAITVRIAGELDEGNVVFVVCDDGWKYLSSGIYTKPVDEIADLESTLWW